MDGMKTVYWKFEGMNANTNEFWEVILEVFVVQTNALHKLEGSRQKTERQRITSKRMTV